MDTFLAVWDKQYSAFEYCKYAVLCFIKHLELDIPAADLFTKSIHFLWLCEHSSKDCVISFI